MTADKKKNGGRIPSKPHLTPTETALLESLSVGNSNRELAEIHGISINTVKFHLHNIYEKLGVRNRKQAVLEFTKLNRQSDF